MNLSRSDWYLIQLLVVVVGAIGANEIGFGFISLILLFPAVFLMQVVFGGDKPSQ